MEIFQNQIGEKISGEITQSELRETAYEILIGACRSSTGSKPLTYISQSERSSSTERERNCASSLTTSPSLQRSLTSAAASKVKKALGISSRNRGERKSGGTVGEMIRVQMKVSEQTDSRVRRAFLRIAAGQVCNCFAFFELLLKFWFYCFFFLWVDLFSRNMMICMSNNWLRNWCCCY